MRKEQLLNIYEDNGIYISFAIWGLSDIREVTKLDIGKSRINSKKRYGYKMERERYELSNLTKKEKTN